jgi:hypothetical protein
MSTVTFPNHIKRYRIGVVTKKNKSKQTTTVRDGWVVGWEDCGCNSLKETSLTFDLILD